MRIAFIGAGDISVETAKSLLQHMHSIIMVEINNLRIDLVSEEIDCSFLLGDGTRPDILRELNPEDTDILFCLTNNDQVNILSSMVATSLGFKRVITSIADAEFESVCRELGVKNTIIPVRTISRHLQDIVNGNETVELATVLKDDARFFSFVLEQDSIRIQDLDLPEGAKVICYYRDGTFNLSDESSKFISGDEIVILTHSRNQRELQERW